MWQGERLLLPLLLESSRLFLVVVLGVLGSLVERGDVADGVAHLVHARSLTVVPHGRSASSHETPGVYADISRPCFRSLPHGRSSIHPKISEHPRVGRQTCRRRSKAFRQVSDRYSTWKISTQHGFQERDPLMLKDSEAYPSQCSTW